MTARLSKSTIMSGLQCEKRLWLELHQPEAKDVSKDTEQRFSVGDEVTDIACALHENGHLIKLDNGLSGALAETERILRESPEKPIFEATFIHENVLVRADILKKEAHGYHFIEVKSGASLKDPYVPDCAVQVWVLEGNGLSLSRVELAHIDTKFVYNGDGDYRGLFHRANLMGAVTALKREVPDWVSRFQKVLAGSEPNIEMGAHCDTPYTCPFKNYCSGPSTKYPLSYLPRGAKIAKQLESEGISDIREIPPGRLTNPTQEWVRRVTAEGKAELEPEAREKIKKHPFPRYYLDFETISFAVPIWKGTRPYQMLPFQWSCHVESKSGRVSHKEFLDTSGDPPMRPFIKSLLRAVGESGPIFVYSSFEETHLWKLAGCFPDLSEGIEQIIARLVNLHLLTKRHYYHPDMHGSWSLKKVLPTIAPHLDYDDLGEVQDGNAAGVAYREIIHPDTKPSRRELLAVAMRAYCQRDTEALIALARFLCDESIAI